MPNPIHGAKKGYKPKTDEVSVGVSGYELPIVNITPVHTLTVEERKARRIKNKLWKRRARNMFRKKHGRQS